MPKLTRERLNQIHFEYLGLPEYKDRYDFVDDLISHAEETIGVSELQQLGERVVIQGSGLRDRFAEVVLNHELITGREFLSAKKFDSDSEETEASLIAERCYRLADAMLEAREKKEGK